MSNYLAKFLKITSLRADRELIERWQFDARYHGDQNIKKQMATARRTATALEKALGNFSKLRPEQELAIKAAASAMRALANDMQSIASWAKAYRAFCEIEYKAERAIELETIAANRWGNNDEAMEFEYNLISELTSNPGREALGRWMHGRNMCKHINVDNFYSPFSSGFYAYGATHRTELAEKIEEAIRNRDRQSSWDNRHLHCSWNDYEAYLAYRKEVAQTTAQVIQMVSQN